MKGCDFQLQNHFIFLHNVHLLQHTESSVSSTSLFLSESELFRWTRSAYQKEISLSLGTDGSLTVPNQENRGDGRANRTLNLAVFPLPTHPCIQERCPGERRSFSFLNQASSREFWHPAGQECWSNIRPVIVLPFSR